MTGHPGYTPHLSAREIAVRFGVSERTARRHRAQGTLPDPKRARGADGKTYPGSYRPARREDLEPCHGRDLVMARNAIRRAARGEQFTDHDFMLMQTIAAEATDLLTHWRENREGTQ